MSHWMIYRNGSHEGPYTQKELEEMLAAGRIDDDTPAWTPDMRDYEPVRACLSHLLAMRKSLSRAEDWMLKTGDRTIGPISGEQVRALARAKAIPGDTLARRTSDAEWKPLCRAHPPPAEHRSKLDPEAGPYALEPERARSKRDVHSSIPRPQPDHAVTEPAVTSGNPLTGLMQGRWRGFAAALVVCGIGWAGWSLLYTGGMAVWDNSLEGAVRRNEAAVAQLESALRNPSCGALMNAAAAMVETQRAVMDHPDLPQYIADQRWGPLGSRLNVAIGSLMTAFSSNKSAIASAISGCDEAKLSSLLSESLGFKDRMNRVISSAVMRKVVTDTQRQADRERRGIPEPTPYNCKWCGKPMTHGRWLASLYCSPKCERESR